MKESVAHRGVLSLPGHRQSSRVMQPRGDADGPILLLCWMQSFVLLMEHSRRPRGWVLSKKIKPGWVLCLPINKRHNTGAQC